MDLVCYKTVESGWYVGEMVVESPWICNAEQGSKLLGRKKSNQMFFLRKDVPVLGLCLCLGKGHRATIRAQKKALVKMSPLPSFPLSAVPLTAVADNAPKPETFTSQIKSHSQNT